MVAAYQLYHSCQLIINSPSLSLYRDKLYPMVNWSLNTQSNIIYWIRLRISGIWLYGRTGHLFCPTCRHPTMETPHHFLFICSARPLVPHTLLRDFHLEHMEPKEQVEHLFSELIPTEVRERIGTIVRQSSSLAIHTNIIILSLYIGFFPRCLVKYCFCHTLL